MKNLSQTTKLNSLLQDVKNKSEKIDKFSSVSQ